MENFFTLPGIYLLQALADHAPGVATMFGISDPARSIALVIVISAIAWIFCVVACWFAVMLVRDIHRVSEAIIRTICHRLSQTAGNFRTWVICTYRKLLPHRRMTAAEARPEVSFDDFDFTVLQAAAKCGPGFSTSAPELAGKYGLRPSQFQESLGRLHRNKMLTAVIGSTDGFDNYRLTDYGAAYIKMLDQATFRASAADR